MNTGSFISVNALIESIFREYGFNPTDIDEEAILELVYSGMRLIGAPVFVDRAETLSVENYRASMPADFLYPLAVRHGNTITVLNQSTDLWRNIPGAMAGGTAQTLPVDFPAAVSTNLYPASPEYSFNEHYIFTNFETGDVDVLYKAFPTSLDGKPAIPDDERYITGVKAFVAERIGFRLWMRGQLSREVYEKLDQERNWYVGSADVSVRIPTIDQMQVLQNMLLTLIPNINNHASGFRFAGTMQRIYTHTN